MTINYSFKKFQKDFIAGSTVAVVAIPMALAFGVASGVSAAAGLYSAMIAGLAAAIFGGSRLQITGPTGGMVAVLVMVVSQYGVEKALVAGLMAGIIQIIFGLGKLGKLVKFIPFTVTTGFTAGIAFVIILSQKNNILAAPIVVLATVVLSFFIRRISPRIPVSLLTIILITIAVNFMDLKVPLLGAIPSTLPLPHLLNISLLDIKELFKPALVLAALGSIESLLSAVVADGMMIDEKHDSDKELVGQGLGNVFAPLFGGIAATGAIARTAVNISTGAQTRLAGVIHSLIIFLLMIIFAPLASKIPVAALSGVLVVSAVRMVERENIILVAKSSRPGFVVMGLTLLITIFVDLVTAVEVGLIAAGALFIYKISDLGVYRDDLLDVTTQSCEIAPKVDSRIVAYRIDGPLFFGVVENFINIAAAHPNMKFLILRMRRVPMIDTSGVAALQTIHNKLKRKGCALYMSGLQENVIKRLQDTGFIDEIGKDAIFEWTRDAMLAAQTALNASSAKKKDLIIKEAPS